MKIMVRNEICNCEEELGHARAVYRTEKRKCASLKYFNSQVSLGKKSFEANFRNFYLIVFF